MKDYFYIAAPLILFGSQFIAIKKYQRQVKESVLSSLVFFVLTNIVTFAIFITLNGFKLQINAYSMVFALIITLFMLSYALVSIFAVSAGSVAIFSMFTMLGAIVLPFIYGVIIGEQVPIIRYIGVASMVIFLAVQSFVGSKTTSNGAVFYLLCIITFIINGALSIITAIYQNNAQAISAESFSAFRGLIGVVLGIIIIAFFGKHKLKNNLPQCINLQSSGWSAVYSTLNSFGNYFMLFAVTAFQATVLFPIVAGGTIILSAILSVLIFKEKPSRLETVCLIGAIISTLLFMF